MGDMLDVNDTKDTNAELKCALERTVSKAAIALARLCLNSSMASLVIRSGGLERLSGIMRSTLWNSETVSVAVMAAVTTIKSFDYQGGLNDTLGLGFTESFV